MAKGIIFEKAIWIIATICLSVPLPWSRLIHQLFTVHIIDIPGIVLDTRDVVPEPAPWHLVAKTALDSDESYK